MTVEQYAAHRGVTVKTIQRAIRLGGIELTPRGIYVATADASWSPGKGRPPRSESDPEATASQPTDLSVPPSPPSPHVESHRPRSDEERLLSEVQRAKVDAELAKAKATVVDLQRKAGELIPRDEARDLVTAFAAAVRSRLERLPGRVQDAIAAQCRCRHCGGDVEVRDASIVLEDVLRDELEALADNPFVVIEGSTRKRRRSR